MTVVTAAPARTFPIDAFPARLALFCEAVAEATQTAPEMAACAMLGALSAVSLGIEVDAGGWREELALYLLVVMGPAQRKSSVMGHILRPLELLDRECREDGYEAVKKAETRINAHEKRKQQLFSAQGNTNDQEERERLLEEIDDIDRQLRDLGEPHHYRRLASDATPEVLGTLLAVHGRIAVLASEAAFLDNLLGRYAEGSPNLHLVCQAYEGERAIIDRRRGVEEIDRPLLTIMLAVQEHHLPKLIEHPVAQSQGLVSRFLFATPRSRVGTRVIHAPQVPNDLQEEWANTLRTIDKLLKPAMGDESDTNHKSGGFSDSVANRLIKRESLPPPLSFSPEARAIFDSLRDELEPRLADDGGELAHVSPWANRNPGRLARIAGLLHLAGGHGPGARISGDTMERAARIMFFFELEGRAALERPDAMMRKAYAVLKDWPDETITVNDLHRKVFNAHGPVAPVKQLAADLEEQGHFELVPPITGKIGRPSLTYKINRENLLETTPDAS